MIPNSTEGDEWGVENVEFWRHAFSGSCLYVIILLIERFVDNTVDGVWLTLQSMPYLSERTAKHGEDEVFEGNRRYKGYCVDLAEEIAKKLRAAGILFNYELQLVKDGQYGIKNRDGTWSGMIGELTRRVR